MRPRKNNKKEVRKKSYAKPLKPKNIKNPYKPLILVLKKLYLQKRHEELLAHWYTNDYEFIYMEFRPFIINEIEKEFVYYNIMAYSSEANQDMFLECYNQLRLYNPKEYPGMHIMGYIIQRMKWKIWEKRKKILNYINKIVLVDSDRFLSDR